MSELEGVGRSFAARHPALRNGIEEERKLRAALAECEAEVARLREAVLSLPEGVYEGANRYDTDDEHVLHLWRDGQSWDIRLPKVPDGGGE